MFGDRCVRLYRALPLGWVRPLLASLCLPGTSRGLRLSDLIASLSRPRESSHAGMSKDSKLVEGERKMLGFTFNFGACCMHRGKEHTIIGEWLDGVCAPELVSPASQPLA